MTASARSAAAPALWACTRKGLIRFESAGNGWQLTKTCHLAEPVTLALYDARDGALYAALRLGHFGAKLQRSRDGGESWQEIAMPAFPAGAAPANRRVGAESVSEAPSVDMIWSLAAGGADQPGRLWAGCIPAGLFRSDDHGDSWLLVSSLWERPERGEWFGGGYDQAGIHSLCVDPRNSRRLLLAVSCGGVWISEDDGESWSGHAAGMRADYMPPERAYELNIQDPHRMVQCRAQPDRLWVQHHNGIFRSDDGGRHWQEISGVQPSAFGFAVAVHPQDPDCAWFVPAVKDECRVPAGQKLVVTRTRDAGRHFTALDAGLPTGPSFDLIYRHALVADASGQRLAMASTTGNLWISENGGDHWQLISAHLPPVNALIWAE